MARSSKQAPEETPYREEDAPSGRKLMVTFRIPWETGDWLRHAAEQKKVSINEHVVGLLTDLRTWFGLPFTVTDELESDRKALGLERRDYFVHLLLQRYAAVRERGPGFDGPRSGDRKGTKG